MRSSFSSCLTQVHSRHYGPITVIAERDEAFGADRSEKGRLCCRRYNREKEWIWREVGREERSVDFLKQFDFYVLWKCYWRDRTRMIVSSLFEFEFCFESTNIPTETTNRHFIHGFRDDTPLFPFPASLHSTPLLLPHSTYKRSK